MFVGIEIMRKLDLHAWIALPNRIPPAADVWAISPITSVSCTSALTTTLPPKWNRSSRHFWHLHCDHTTSSHSHPFLLSPEKALPTPLFTRPSLPRPSHSPGIYPLIAWVVAPDSTLLPHLYPRTPIVLPTRTEVHLQLSSNLLHLLVLKCASLCWQDKCSLGDRLTERLPDGAPGCWLL